MVGQTDRYRSIITHVRDVGDTATGQHRDANAAPDGLERLDAVWQITKPPADSADQRCRQRCPGMARRDEIRRGAEVRGVGVSRSDG